MLTGLKGADTPFQELNRKPATVIVQANLEVTVNALFRVLYEPLLTLARCCRVRVWMVESGLSLTAAV